MQQPRSRWRTTLAVLTLDLVLTVTMVALFSFNLTGLRPHEWLGLLACVLIPVHLLLNWTWLAATTRLLLGALPWRVRLRYLLNAGLFVSFIVVTLSGLVISEALFPSLTRLVGNGGFWHPLHTQSSNATLILVGLHLGVYWRNIVNLVKRIATGQRRDTSVRTPAGVAASRLGA